MGVSMNSSMSRILSPMRNTDIKRLEKTGDWTELMQKATAQTNRFRRDFYWHDQYEYIMKIETAIKQLNKEQAFLGLGLLELLKDIDKVGAMVYSKKTMDAYRVFMTEGSKLFAKA